MSIIAILFSAVVAALGFFTASCAMHIAEEREYEGKEIGWCVLAMVVGLALALAAIFLHPITYELISQVTK